MINRRLCNAFKAEHRLSRALKRGLAILATDPAQTDASFLVLAFAICNLNFQNILAVACGHLTYEVIYQPQGASGVIDSLQFLTSRTDEMSRLLL